MQRNTCFYRPWGEIVCSSNPENLLPTRPSYFSYNSCEHFSDNANLPLYGSDVQHSRMLPSTDRETMAVLFEQPPLLLNDNTRLFPPRFGAFLRLPVGNHNNLNSATAFVARKDATMAEETVNFASRANALLVPPGTTVSLFKEPNLTNIVGTWSAHPNAQPLVVDLSRVSRASLTSSVAVGRT